MQNIGEATLAQPYTNLSPWAIKGVQRFFDTPGQPLIGCP